MSKHFITTGLSAVTLAAGLMMAAPAQAQLGGVTGSVSGTLDAPIRSTTDISARTRTRAKVKTPQPRSNVRIKANSPVTVTYGTTRSGGYHSHNHYGRHTHTHGYDHFYDDHSHGHAHGHSHAHSGGSHVYLHGEIKSRDKDKPSKDKKQAEVMVVYTKAELLTYGTPLRTQSGASMGTIKTLQRTQEGEIVGVTASNTLNVIPVEELTVYGNVLVHTLPEPKPHTKTDINFEAEVVMVD